MSKQVAPSALSGVIRSSVRDLVDDKPPSLIVDANEIGTAGANDVMDPGHKV